MTEPPNRPVIRLRPKVSPRRLRFGYPWVFADELVMDRRTRAIAPGAVVRLEDGNRAVIGAAAFNAQSKIAARLLDADADAVIDEDWFAARIARAAALRRRLYSEPCYRLVHAEADGLPGIVIDRFGDAAVIQPNTAWAEAHFDALAAAVLRSTGITTLIRNGSGRARALEGLPEETEIVAGTLGGPVAVRMNGATYMADLAGGQKTGLFYDQRENHAFAARLADGLEMLDVFTHVGGFALAVLAGGARRALAIDASRAALELAEKGARASGFGARLETSRGDAFKAMQELIEAERRFGLVVCDPPAFAPSRAALDRGLRAYERVARLAASLVEPEGYLVLCSCSHAATPETFLEACKRGIGRAGRRAAVLHQGGAGPDHPLHSQLAESGYLKAFFFRLT